MLPSEAEYFGALQDDLPGLQVEATVGLPQWVHAESIGDDLVEYFGHNKGPMGLFVPHTLTATQVIDKYRTPTGTFSVLHLDDHSAVLKKKTHRKRTGVLRVSREDRVAIQPGDGAVDVAVDRYGLDPQDITYLGRLVRDKSRVAIINSATGRVYTATLAKVNLTVLAAVGDGPAHGTPALKELAIEYKGTVPGAARGHKAPQAPAGDLIKARKEIEHDVTAIRSEIHKHLRKAVAAPGAQSKRRWMEDAGGHQPQPGSGLTFP